MATLLELLEEAPVASVGTRGSLEAPGLFGVLDEVAPVTTLGVGGGRSVAGITVEEVRLGALPPETRLLGGSGGVGRVVSGTALMRARTPAFPPLHGGELALVSLTLLRQMESRPRLDRLVAQLADARVSGIVLLALRPDDAALRAAAAAAAETNDIPVLEVTSEASAERLETALQRYLASRRDELLRRSQELQQEFTALAFAGRGLPAIVERLAAVTGLPSVWEDRELELRSWVTPPGPPGRSSASATSSSALVAAEGARTSVAAGGGPTLVNGTTTGAVGEDLPTLLRGARLPLLRWSRTVAPGGRAEVAQLPLRADEPLTPNSLKRLVVPFSAGNELGGFLSVIARNGEAAHEVRLALAGAALAASIETLRAGAVIEAQQRAVTTVVRDWMEGRFASSEEVLARLRQLGYVVAPPFAVLALEHDAPFTPDQLARLTRPLVTIGQSPSPKAPANTSPKTTMPAASTTTAAGGATSAAAAGEPAPTILVTELDERRSVVIVSHVLADQPEPAAVSTNGQASSGTTEDPASAATAATLASARMEQAAQALQALVPRYGGLGRLARVAAEVPRAYREALQALGVARRLANPPRVSYFGTLGVYRLLAAVQPDAELRCFREDLLGPLLAHDQKTGGDLVRTLELYVECGGSPIETAERLHTHRNTVLYRVDRINEILGTDVRQPVQRSLLYLAFRAGDVLHGDGNENASSPA